MWAEVAIPNPGLLDLFEDAEADCISEMNEGDREIFEKSQGQRRKSGNSWENNVYICMYIHIHICIHVCVYIYIHI